jgi:WD40 repeat protein
MVTAVLTGANVTISRRDLTALGIALSGSVVSGCGDPFGFTFTDGIHLTNAGANASLKITKPYAIPRHPQQAGPVAFNSADTLLATGCEDGKIRIFDAATGSLQRVIQAHDRGITFLEFDADGAIILSSSWDSATKLWNVETGQTLGEWTGISSTGADDARVIPTKNRAIFRNKDDWKLALWDTKNRKIMASLSVNYGCWGFDASNDGKFIVTTSEVDLTRIISMRHESKFRIWDANDGKLLRVFEELFEPVRVVTFSPDSKYIAVFDGSFTITVWRVSDGKKIFSTKPQVAHVSQVFNWSPDSRLLAVYDEFSNKPAGYIFDVISQKIVTKLNAPDTFAPQFSANGKFLFTRSTRGGLRGRTYIVGVSTGDLLAELRGPSSEGGGPYISETGKFLATAYVTGEVQVWQIG